ncbi:MAG: L-serine ammonia-lyase, iron-sulfur-dependent, subunit alpha [Oscillospiraceae bacterium]
MLSEEITSAYLSILKDELIPATGCTEPIAVAYCAAKLREVLGARPETITAEVSGNILKNVKSVAVPNTGGLKGLKAAIAIGVVAGDPAKELLVISDVRQEQHAETAAYSEAVPIRIECMETPHLLDICLTGTVGTDSAIVRIVNKHTNIVLIRKNGETLFSKPEDNAPVDQEQTKSIMNVRDIVTFADTVEIEKLGPILDRQIEYNSAIAEKGLRGNWGANIGSVLQSDFGEDIKVEAMAYAAAGSDARMSGCELPVVILSGSGNQGITAALPVIRYAKHMGAVPLRSPIS